MRAWLGSAFAIVLLGCAQVQEPSSAQGLGASGAGGAGAGAEPGGAADAEADGDPQAEGAGGGSGGHGALDEPFFQAGAAAPAADPCAMPPMEGMAQPDCPCEPGTMPASCDPPDIRVVQNGLMGSLVCSEGVAYCRRGTWSKCELLLQYAKFVPD